MKVTILFAFLFVLLAAVLAVPRAAPQLGANKCTRGPGYWCASRANAVACNAVKHCEENVWRQ